MMDVSVASQSSTIQGYPGLSAMLILSCLGLTLLGTVEWILGRYLLGSSWARLLIEDRVRQSRILLGVAIAIATAILLVANVGKFAPIATSKIVISMMRECA